MAGFVSIGILQISNNSADEEKNVKISVLGAGAGGTAMAFDCANHGHDVRLFDFPEFPGNIAAVAKQGGIHADGDIEGFAEIASAGHDIDEDQFMSLLRAIRQSALRKDHSPGL
jgi:3-hydroxyacyl-CoA dehydrogenase